MVLQNWMQRNLQEKCNGMRINLSNFEQKDEII